MKVAFLIYVAYALLGMLYAPSIDSYVALIFVAVSCVPLLLAALYEDQSFANFHKAPGGLLFWGFVGLGLFNLVLIANRVDKSVSELLSTEGFVSIANLSTTNRYTEQGSSGNPILLSLSLFLLYRLGATGNALPAWRKIIGFSPVLLYSMLTTEKWAMFLGVAFFLTGLFVSLPYRVARNTVLRSLPLFSLFGLGLGLPSLILRGFKGEAIDGVNLLLHYVLAPYSALGYWISNDATWQCCTLGEFSFIGLLNAIGLATREAGVYTENFSVYDIETNIYTSFRYWAQDFSLFAPLLLNSGLSALFIGFRSLRLRSGCIAISGFVIFSALLSLNVTPFVHNTTALAMVLALTYSATMAHRSMRILSIAHE